MLCFVMLMSLAGCFHYVARYDDTYRGKVVNAETGEPIEGVVVLGVWYTEIGTVAGPKHHYYDATETVTDKNGEFEIHGKGLRLFSNLEPVYITVFKAGYNESGLTWKPEKEGDYIYHPDIKWKDNRPTIPLKKLTMEERKRRGTPSRHSSVPIEKMKLLTEEINKERIYQGLKPFPNER